MAKTKSAVLFGSLVTSSLCLAGSPDRQDPAFSNATEATALKFVDSYYAHMDRGMSRKHLENYWTEGKLEDFDTLTVSIANITGKDLVQESQRLMDLQHMDAKCEELELSKAETYGPPSSRSKLEFIVKNICADWKGPITRTIALRFSTEHKQWLIHDIEDGE